MIDITAVIPSYNRAHLLDRSIASASQQTYAPVETIVVDDGSTDETESVVASMGEAVRYVHQNNAGGAAARNRGVAEATTEWVAFLDSDDLWLPDHLERIVAAIEATDGAADIYFGDVVRTEEEGGERTFASAGIDFEGPYLLREDARGWAVALYQPAMLQGMVIRKSTFDEVGGLWPELSSRHDTHFFYFAFIDHPACAVSGPTVQMTADENVDNRLTGGTGNRTRRYWECTVTLYRDVLDKRSDRNERRLARAALARGLKRLAVFQWSDGERLSSVKTAARAVATEPVAVAASLLPGNPTLSRYTRARDALGG